MSEQKKQNLADPSVRKGFITYKEATEFCDMRLCHVLEENYNALEAVAVYLFGRMYEVYSELAKKYIGNQWLCCIT